MVRKWGKGTRLTYTEQGAYLGTSIASAKGHEEGCRGLLEKLAAELESSRQCEHSTA